MNCKKCGASLESSWKICPNCGSPTGVQKSAQHKKKAIYKNGWFWVAILLLTIVLGHRHSVQKRNKG
ncbi:zinc-ribbon domain-containing protein [Schaedlerella arabinosiphila]|uniref:Zinc-ribbon domain-containing protein n=1 Tax=Schaedlerella arabinosiphila TaxID=2044587 RepID=A0A3R8JMK3_9FIRM|nr:zinc-ribbon domain-containing protein [Schaedlerella arabinosiphila]